MSWNRTLESLIRNEMKYCFMASPVDGSYPIPDEKELEEFLGAVRVVLFDEMKKLFFRAYRIGCSDTIDDIAPGGYSVDEILNRIGAERRWSEDERNS